MKTLLLLLLISYVSVTNTTDDAFIGSAVEQGLAVLDINPESVIIVETPAHRLADRNYLDEMNGTYYLYIDPDQRQSTLLRVIAHELIHIEQYERGDLTKDLNGDITWRGELYDLEVTARLHRPWETEAESREYKLQRAIERQLK